MLFPSTRGFAVVDAAAIGRNFCLLRTLARQSNPNARPIAVVKANAYGHGIAVAVPALLAAGCDFFAVATPDEALALRTLAPQADILVLGYTPPQLAPALAAAGITQTVFSPTYARSLGEALQSKPLHIHLKIDGGMCRLGLDPTDMEGQLLCLEQRGLIPTGLFTHFPTADTDQMASKAALAAFLACRRSLQQAGFSLFSHAAASAAALTLPEAILDGIRPGLALYGIPPVQTTLPLTPALSLHAPLVQLREVPAGTKVGYGGAFVTRRPTRIGVLPIGYADGLPRALSGLVTELYHGNSRYPVPLVGRICMDQAMVDVTDTPACIGDPICLWQDATAVAKRLSTIPYEVLTTLSQRLYRLTP